MCNCFCLPSEKWSSLKGKNLPLGSKFFPFRVDHFLEGALASRKVTGSQKRFLGGKFWREINTLYPVPLSRGVKKRTK